ncbi:hypothetical protein Slin15195_G101930 [Septoria linicola]|uniref:NTF2-like domain-containing protein n=1 Tax=Septoria linicola TaxID=215465 RepID=A0A9Q9AXI4_9PEZI|nr:hypothetical protein Slin14017_G064930 [Septoria linicola]USW56874.1 hypothetical protein Slin15195_G101930 [Septoria linicola]
MRFQLISLAIEALLLQIGQAQTCLTDGGAFSFDTVFRNIISKAPGHEELVDTFLSPSFEFVSDSLAFLTGGILNATGAHNAEELWVQYENNLPKPPEPRLLHVAHSCDTVTTYWQILVGGIPIRGFNLIFVDTESRKITKVYTEINSGAARYAIYQLDSPACPQEVKFELGNEGPPFGFSGCQARL